MPKTNNSALSQGNGICSYCHGTGKNPNSPNKGEPCLMCDGNGRCYHCKGLGLDTSGNSCELCENNYL
jgi:hypothetical protein